MPSPAPSSDPSAQDALTKALQIVARQDAASEQMLRQWGFAALKTMAADHRLVNKIVKKPLAPEDPEALAAGWAVLWLSAVQANRPADALSVVQWATNPIQDDNAIQAALLQIHALAQASGVLETAVHHLSIWALTVSQGKPNMLQQTASGIAKSITHPPYVIKNEPPDQAEQQLALLDNLAGPSNTTRLLAPNVMPFKMVEHLLLTQRLSPIERAGLLIVGDIHSWPVRQGTSKASAKNRLQRMLSDGLSLSDFIAADTLLNASWLVMHQKLQHAFLDIQQGREHLNALPRARREEMKTIMREAKSKPTRHELFEIESIQLALNACPSDPLPPEWRDLLDWAPQHCPPDLHIRGSRDVLQENVTMPSKSARPQKM